MPTRTILSVCPRRRWPQTTKWRKFSDRIILSNFVFLLSHFQRTSARLLSVQCTPTTRRSHASSGPRPVNASSVRAAHSIMIPMRREDSSTHCQIFQRVLRSHLCLKNLKKQGTIINIRIIITATIPLATVTIPLISPETIRTSSTFRPTSICLTTSVSKTQWFK